MAELESQDSKQTHSLHNSDVVSFVSVVKTPSLNEFSKGLILIDGEVPLVCPPLRRAFVTQEHQKSTSEKKLYNRWKKIHFLIIPPFEV